MEAKTFRTPAKLSQVIKVHRQWESETDLPTILGDGFLYRHNLVYRNIRDVYLNCGFKFTNEDFCQYNVIESAALKHFLEEGTLYYRETYLACKRMADVTPDMTLDRVPGFKENNIIHESAHLIADAILPLGPVPKNPEGEREFVLNAFMAEAFAVTTVVMGKAYADSLDHAMMWRFNSHQPADDDHRARFERSVKVIGSRSTFKLMYFAHLFWSFLFSELKPEGLSLILSYCGAENVNKKHLDFLLEFFNSCFKLNKAFPTQVQDFYFRYLGLEKDVHSLADFNFLKMIREDTRRMSAIDQFADVMLEGKLSSLTKQSAAA
jgi:hypothetical protein